MYENSDRQSLNLNEDNWGAGIPQESVASWVPNRELPVSANFSVDEIVGSLNSLAKTFNPLASFRFSVMYNFSTNNPLLNIFRLMLAKKITPFEDSFQVLESVFQNLIGTAIVLEMLFGSDIRISFSLVITFSIGVVKRVSSIPFLAITVSDLKNFTLDQWILRYTTAAGRAESWNGIGSMPQNTEFSIINLSGVIYAALTTTPFMLQRIPSINEYNKNAMGDFELQDFENYGQAVESLHRQMVRNLENDNDRLLFPNNVDLDMFKYRHASQVFITILGGYLNSANNLNLLGRKRYPQFKTEKAVPKISFNVQRYNRPPGGGGIAGSYVELPKEVVSKFGKCLLNIRNLDFKCFFYCLNAWSWLSFCSDKNKLQRKYNSHLWCTSSDYCKLDWGCITTDKGVSFADVTIFANHNNITIIIYELVQSEVGYKVILLRKFNDTHSKDRSVCFLLLYRKHYILIRNYNRFFQFTANSTQLQRTKYACSLCNKFSFFTKKALEEHISKRCSQIVYQDQYYLPKKDFLQFQNFNNSNLVKRIISCDFEAYFTKSDKEDTENTEYSFKHVPFLLSSAMIDETGKFLGLKMFEGDSLITDFLLYIDSIALSLSQERDDYVNKFKSFSNFFTFKKCLVCNSKVTFSQYFFSKELDQVIHSRCLSKYCDTVFSIKIFFHNFKNYDLHFLANYLFRMKKLFVIPKSREKYTTVQYETNKVLVRFVDSRSFLQGSLSSLAKKLTSFKFIGIGDFENLKKLTTKQFFPYEYITSKEVLFESSLPSNKEQWYSSLTEESANASDIDHANNIFKEFNCSNIFDYAKLYVTVDVLLLLEVMLDFRNSAISSYSIDPLHYYTLPGYAWDVALKSSKISLYFLKDHLMINLIRNNIRGGISSVCETNRITETDQNSLFYWDANNLYGWAMTQKMPISNFELMNVAEYDWNLFISSFTMDGDYGYMLEVDLDYPSNLHDYHNGLPFLPEKINDKLCLSLMNKRNYFAHIMNIQQSINHGLVLVCVKTAIKFKHGCWLESYINLNTKMRKESTTPSMKDFYKLMNNAVFGKSMENVFKRCKYIPTGNDEVKKHNKIRMERGFINEEAWGDNITMFEVNKVPCFDKPMYTGFTILELSKWKMYDTFYSGIKRKWPDSILAYMDTDSFVMSIPKDGPLLDFSKVDSYFDLSVYDKNSPNYSNSNESVLGKMKDEYPDTIAKPGRLVDFIAIRSKSYAMKFSNGKEIVKNKGTGCLKSITFKDYQDQLDWPSIVKIPQTMFHSFKHEINTIRVNKQIFSSKIDDKRNYSEGKVLSLGYNK